MSSEPDLHAKIKEAWEKTTENLRREVTLGIQKVDPALFKEWIARARLDSGGFRPQKVASRDPAYKDRLDRALWSDDASVVPSESLAGKILYAYFTRCDHPLNDAFMTATTEQKLSDEGGDASKVEAVLAKIKSAETKRPDKFELYITALRWLHPGWFQTDKPAEA